MRLVLCKAAVPHWGIRRNRYYIGTPHEQTIGLAFCWGRQTYLSWVWRSPRAPGY